MRLRLLLLAALFPLAPSAFGCTVPLQNCGGAAQPTCSAVWEQFNECKRAEFRNGRDPGRAIRPATVAPSPSEALQQSPRAALVERR